MSISRRTFVKGMAASVALPLLSFPGKALATPGPVVQTPKGAVQGMVQNGVHTFFGVPCGKPPYEAARRLALPLFVDPWQGVVECTKLPSTPLQRGPMVDGQASIKGGGDCLRLNIWTPAPGKSLCPVLVYIPGGGSVNCDNGKTSGHNFARDGVVTVALNYRVNVDGFMRIDDVPANLALHDMIHGLRWVKDNIAAFGGDPNRVTVMGQSAGATHICSLLASPLAKGLFERAILMSGSMLAQWTPEQAQKSSELLYDYYGVPHNKAGILSLSEEKLLSFARLAGAKAQDAEWNRYCNGNVTLFKPYVDGEVLPKRPVEAVADGSCPQVDTLIGCTAYEWSYQTVPNGLVDRLGPKDVQFVLDGIGAPASLPEAYRKNGRGTTDGEIYTAIQSDIIFRIPTNRLLEARAKSGGNTWAYSFNWKSPAFDHKIGASHGCDIPFAFDTLGDPDSLSRRLGDNPPQALADKMHAAWVNFISKGDPGWSSYDLATRKTMSIDLEWREEADPWRHERELLHLK